MKKIIVALFLIILSSSAFASKYNFFLSRGLVREKRHWGDFDKRLLKAFPGSNVVLLEIPGTGVYNKMKVPLKVSEIVEVMRKDYLKEKKKLPDYPNVILAMSFGGMIGTEWLFNHPDDFQYAVFGNTSFGGFCGTFDRFRPSNLMHVLKFPFADQGEEREKLVLEMVSNRPDLRDKAGKKWGEILKDAPVSLGNSARQLFAAFRYHPPQRIPDTPILLLASKKDRLVNVACSEAIHMRWNVPIRFHESAGHVIALDAPNWIVKEMYSWLEHDSSVKK